MQKLILKVDFDRLTLDDLVSVEEGDLSARFVRSILARFATDPEGELLPEDQAIKVAGKLTVNEAQAAVEDFAAKVKEIREDKIPPTNGGN